MVNEELKWVIFVWYLLVKNSSIIICFVANVLIVLLFLFQVNNIGHSTVLIQVNRKKGKIN